MESGSIKKNGLYDTVTELMKKMALRYLNSPELSRIQDILLRTKVRQSVKRKILSSFLPLVSGGMWVMQALPVVAVLTNAATGSEMDAWAVITNMDTNEKNRFLKGCGFMKRLYSMILLLAVLSCLTACGKGSQMGQTDANSGATSQKEESVMNQGGMSKANTNILVAYFSCTGTTKPLAEYAAEYLNADLYEIKAETPYTSEDLDYNASGSRANKEQEDTSARPAVSGKVEDMDKYQTVVLAYPKMEYGISLCI